MKSTSDRRLLIVADVVGGGLGAVAREQAAWFGRQGWRVAIALPVTGPVAIQDAGIVPVETPNVEVVQLAIPRSVRHASDMTTAVRQLRRFIVAWRPDVVHAHGMRSFTITRLASIRRPYVTLHGTGPLPDDPTGYGLLRSTGVVIVPYLAKRAYNAGTEPRRGWSFLAHASPRLQSLPALDFPADGIPRFLWVGGLVEPKRPDLFVRAIGRAASSAPIRGVMAGDGVLRPEIEDLIRSLGAPVEVLGRVDDVRPFLEDAWAVALFSRFEALAFAVQEAMWVGRPVVASPLASLQWLLGTSGSYADDLESATEAILRLTNRELAMTLGRETAARIRTRLHPGDPWSTIERDYLADLRRP